MIAESVFFVFVFGMPSSPGQCLALNEAVKCNAATLVKSLIEADANPQLKDGHGETAIQCALAEMMPLLLAVKAPKFEPKGTWTNVERSSKFPDWNVVEDGGGW